MKFVIRLYTILLRLYPRSFREEFAEEMYLVFLEAIKEADEQGGRAILTLVLREVRDLPSSILFANWQARKGFIMQSPVEIEKRMNALGILAGILPFILLGPLQAIMPYAPRDFRESVGVGSDRVMIGFLFVTAVGTIIGSIQRFPRWSYPYLVTFVFILFANGIARLTLLLPQERIAIQEDFLLGARLAMLLALLFVLAGIVVLVARLLKPLRYLYQGIRQDWTLLSFGLFSYVAFVFGLFGGDHPPPFGISVLLPTLIIVFGALLHLLSANRRQRILALLLSLVLLVTVGGIGEDSWLALLFLIAVVFLPALLELLPSDKKIATA